MCVPKIMLRYVVPVPDNEGGGRKAIGQGVKLPGRWGLDGPRLLWIAGSLWDHAAQILQVSDAYFLLIF